MGYNYLLIRKKDRVVEYAIYSYNEDGSINDLEDVVILGKDEWIVDYIRKYYWALFCKQKQNYN